MMMHRVKWRMIPWFDFHPHTIRGGRMLTRHRLFAALLIALIASPLFAETATTTTAPTTKPAGKSDAGKADGKRPSAAEVMSDLTGRIERNPAIEPTQRIPPSIAPQPNEAVGVAEDAGAAVQGVAPVPAMGKLRKEGEFVINRPGRLVRAPQSGILMFAFESDAPNASEPPVIIMPCAYLQYMEDMARERGDRVVFIISGQVTSYRGANYLLPTNVRQGIDRGNLSK
jgi:hypothetical protein